MLTIAFDWETELAQPGLAAPPPVCGAFAIDKGDRIATDLLDPVDAVRALDKLFFERPDSRLVGCNVAFDLSVLTAYSPRHVPLVFEALEQGRVHDIAIREALTDIAKGDLVDAGDEGLGVRYGLKLLASRHLGVDLTEDKKGPASWRKRYALLAEVPLADWPKEAREYPQRDAAYTLEVFRRQAGENLHQEAHEVRAAFALQLASVHGLRSCRDAVAKLRTRVEAADRENVERFTRAGLLRPNGTEDKKRLAELVTAAYRGAPPKTSPSSRFPSGQVASDRDTLVQSGDELLETYGRAGKNDKYLTTYLPILEAGLDQPWNPQFNVLVSTTRVSSDAQQFPQKGGVRECWEARSGYVFCSVDYGGLELRTMAQRAIYEGLTSKLAEALNNGLDPHLIAAASFQGVTYEVSKAAYKSGDATTKAFRDLGKIWNFGKGGGMGPGAMVYNARVGKGETTTGPDGRAYSGTRFCLLLKEAATCGTETETIKVRGKARRVCSKCVEVARRLDAGWLRAWPEQAELFRRANALAKTSRYLRSTIPVSNVVRGQCGYTQWLNTPFQGLGAYATKRAMWRVCREMYDERRSPLFGSRLVLQVHDELIAEMPEAVAAEAGDRMALIMREELARVCPDLAPSIEAEPALSKTLSKSAATVRDERGRLLVWQAAA